MKQILIPTTLGVIKISPLGNDKAQASIYQGSYGEEGAYFPAVDIFLDLHDTSRFYEALKSIYARPVAAGTVAVDLDPSNIHAAPEAVIILGGPPDNPLKFLLNQYLTQLEGKKVRVYIEEVE